MKVTSKLPLTSKVLLLFKSDSPKQQSGGVFAAAGRVLAGVVLLASVLPAQEKANLVRVPQHFNVQAETACETEMLRQMGAREVFSGTVYEVLTDVARAYGLAIPHIYIFPGSLNMAYIAGSSALDGRGKIVVGRQAIESFDALSLKGFLGHEMAHLVNDKAAQGCNDYILRDPQMELEADALAARTLGTAPVKAFLQRVLALTNGQNWDAKHRLEVLSTIPARLERLNHETYLVGLAENHRPFRCSSHFLNLSACSQSSCLCSSTPKRSILARIGSKRTAHLWHTCTRFGPIRITS